MSVNVLIIRLVFDYAFLRKSESSPDSRKAQGEREGGPGRKNADRGSHLRGAAPGDRRVEPRRRRGAAKE